MHRQFLILFPDNVVTQAVQRRASLFMADGVDKEVDFFLGIKLDIAISLSINAFPCHVGIGPVNLVSGGIVIGDKDKAVSPLSKLIIGRHLEEVAFLHIGHKDNGIKTVLFLRERLIIPKTSGLEKRIPVLGGFISPLQSISVRSAVLFGFVIWNHQTCTWILRHPIAASRIFKQMDSEVFADINIRAVVGTLKLAVCFIVKVFGQSDYGINPFLTYGGIDIVESIKPHFIGGFRIRLNSKSRNAENEEKDAEASQKETFQ